MNKKHTFISGLRASLFHNSPLLLGGILLLIIGLFAGRTLRIIAYSLFLCFLLSCAFESVFGISSSKMFSDDDEKESDGGNSGQNENEKK